MKNCIIESNWIFVVIMKKIFKNLLNIFFATISSLKHLRKNRSTYTVSLWYKNYFSQIIDIFLYSRLIYYMRNRINRFFQLACLLFLLFFLFLFFYNLTKQLRSVYFRSPGVQTVRTVRGVTKWRLTTPRSTFNPTIAAIRQQQRHKVAAER